MIYPLTYPPASLCILRLSAIGDVSHVLPTLRVLQRSWPDTAITWIIGKAELPLVEDIHGVDFIVYDKSLGWKAQHQLFATLKDRRFDLLFNMQASLRASLASLAVRAPLRIGFDRKRAKGLQWLFTNRKIAAVPHQHVLDSFLEFPKALGLDTSEIRWDIPIPEAAHAKAKELLPKKQPFLVINPCSSMRTRNYRNWDVSSYAKIIDFSSEKYGLCTVLTGGPSYREQDYASQIAEAAQAKPCNLVGRTSLKELLAVLSQARVVIAPDTGPVHLANALGTPVVGLYATSNPDRTGPYLNHDLTINSYPLAVQKEFGKNVDDIAWGRRVRNPDAMQLINNEAVQEKLEIALQSRHSGDKKT